MASMIWFCSVPYGTRFKNLPGLPPKTEFLGTKVFSDNMVLSSMMQLSSITTLSSKTQFLPTHTQFPIKLAFTIVEGPIIEYLPIVIEVNWVPY